MHFKRDVPVALVARRMHFDAYAEQRILGKWRTKCWDCQLRGSGAMAIDSEQRGHRRLWKGLKRGGFSLMRIYAAVLFVLFLLENKLIFPAPRFPSGDWEPDWLSLENVDFASADGTALHGWYLDHPNPKAFLLYCHGNGEHIAYTAPVLEELRTTLDVAVFAFDYRGYGRSDGAPNEAGILADGEAAHDWLCQRAGLARDQIVVMGRSIGGAVAVDIASRHQSRALILESTFPSLPDIAARLHWWAPVRLLMRTRLDSIAKIANYQGALMQSHGTADTLIPLNYGKRLFDAAPGQDKRFLSFDGIGHNDYPPDDYYDELRLFLEHCRLRSADIGTS